MAGDVAESVSPDGRFAVLVLQKYTDDHDVEAELRAYLDRMLGLIGSVGGRIVWSGRPVNTVVGNSDERWDVAVVVEYPSVMAAMKLASDPAFVEAVEYRSAAIERLEIHACLPVIDAPRG